MPRHNTIIRLKHLIKFEDGIDDRIEFACKEVSNVNQFLVEEA